MSKKKPTLKEEVSDALSYTIDISTYKAKVILVYSPKQNVTELCAQILKAHNLPDEGPNNDGGDGAVTITLSEDRLVYIVMDKNSDISMLHHECIHAATYLFYLIQTNHNQSTDEVFAYLSDTLFTECYKMLLGQFKIPKKSFLTVE